MSKLCCDCKQIKSFSEFYKNESKKSGYNNYCKQCSKEYMREYLRKLRRSEKGPRLQFMKNIHKYIRRHKPQQDYCSICNENKKLELSNISGEYKKDIIDYQWLCNQCHRLYDKITQTHKIEVTKT